MFSRIDVRCLLTPLLVLGTACTTTAVEPFRDAADAEDNGAFFSPNRPKLVLQITVDQFRGDLPVRFYDSLGEGGLRYLWENGIVYSDAHHAHANTETIVGHTTLATGAHPSVHGMVGNLWFDSESGFITYNVEDPDYRLLTAGAGVDQATEVDPNAARCTQRRPLTDGHFSDDFLR